MLIDFCSFRHCFSLTFPVCFVCFFYSEGIAFHSSDGAVGRRQVDVAQRPSRECFAFGRQSAGLSATATATRHVLGRR